MSIAIRSCASRAALLFCAGLIVLGPDVTIRATDQGGGGRRPMTFLDMQQMRQAGAPAPSQDGRWLLYTISTPDWKEAKRQTDIYLVSLQQGVASAKQMTFTKEKNETEPRWSRDGSFFIFASNREAPSTAATQNQIYRVLPARLRNLLGAADYAAVVTAVSVSR